MQLMDSYIILFTSLLLTLSTSKTVVPFSLFVRDSSRDDYACSDEHVLFASKKKGQACMSMCVYHSTCSRVFVGTTQCIGCFFYNGTGGFVQSKGTVHYVLKDMYGEKCNGADRCEGRNLECWDDTCICQIGYSYNPRTNACVERCSSYGNSFQVYPERRLNGLNDKAFGKMSLEECKNRCVKYNCLSLEYKSKERKCHLSNSTVLTNPDRYERRNTMDYYTRNCAK